MFGLSPNPRVEIKVDSIRIRLRPLDLGIPIDQLVSNRERAVREKTADDIRAYQQSTFVLQHRAEEAGYFRSTAHNAWAAAAAARTGGLLFAEWWQRFDPFGGTAGNGPQVLPQGRYPGLASRVAMAHDTDWSLGRYFGVGPLSQLRGSRLPPLILGSVGLASASNIAVGMDPDEIYSFGHPDWDVSYE